MVTTSVDEQGLLQQMREVFSQRDKAQETVDGVLQQMREAFRQRDKAQASVDGKAEDRAAIAEREVERLTASNASYRQSSEHWMASYQRTCEQNRILLAEVAARVEDRKKLEDLRDTGRSQEAYFDRKREELTDEVATLTVKLGTVKDQRNEARTNALYWANCYSDRERF